MRRRDAAFAGALADPQQLVKGAGELQRNAVLLPQLDEYLRGGVLPGKVVTKDAAQRRVDRLAETEYRFPETLRIAFCAPQAGELGLRREQRPDQFLPGFRHSVLLLDAQQARLGADVSESGLQRCGSEPLA